MRVTVTVKVEAASGELKYVNSVSLEEDGDLSTAEVHHHLGELAHEIAEDAYEALGGDAG